MAIIVTYMYHTGTHHSISFNLKSGSYASPTGTREVQLGLCWIGKTVR